VSDPKADNSKALFLALSRGHTECVELLWPLSDVAIVLKDLKNEHGDHWRDLEERHLADLAKQQNLTLSNELGVDLGVPGRKNKI
jgi:hypothetical protein